jgi:hypothetical protein
LAPPRIGMPMLARDGPPPKPSDTRLSSSDASVREMSAVDMGPSVVRRSERSMA